VQLAQHSELRALVAGRLLVRAVAVSEAPYVAVAAAGLAGLQAPVSVLQVQPVVLLAPAIVLQVPEFVLPALLAVVLLAQPVVQRVPVAVSQAQLGELPAAAAAAVLQLRLPLPRG
jgi:hypothetical protein